MVVNPREAPTPTIAGDVGGIPLQIEDGKTGYLVSSPEECARRSVEILSDPELGKRLARAGKEHARENFLTPRLLRDWLGLFGDLDVASELPEARAVEEV